jgi:hypothetical protein
MFAYFTKINSKDNIVSLYYDNYNDDNYNDDNYNDDEYLFNTQTIAKWANEYNVKFISFIPSDEIIVKSNDNIIPLFSYS